MPPPPVTATYRFQLNPDFTLDHAADRLPYLVELGASHVYISPVLSSVPGSSHGYDVVDHSSVAEHLGGMAAFNRFTDAARAADLGVVLDIVPNHMSIRGPHNRRWLDVLEHGPSSGSASWFDIDWVGRERHQRGVLVLPVLDDLYGAVLASGVLTLGRRGSRFHVDCPGHRFPLSPRSLPFVLRPVVDELRSAPTASRDHVETLSFVVDALTRLEPATTAAERCRRGEHLRVLDRLLATLAGDRAIGEALDRALGAANAEPAVVHRVLEEQHYRLSYWRTALKELDYRRFFDVSDLAAIRTERDEVFDAVHALPLQWIGEGRIDGLRVEPAAAREERLLVAEVADVRTPA
jgi:(1->4)-alpha-D-glucan 1-alpha-D-glucosylmutase